MTDTYESLLNEHIIRLTADVAERDSDNPWHQELNKVDSKNIASLREGRIPKYGDHMDCLLGDDEYDMHEFRDLTYEKEHEAAGLYEGVEPSLT